MRRCTWFGVALAFALALTVAFLTLPVVALVVDVAPSRLLASLGRRQSLDALQLSLLTTAIAMACIVLVGTPAAYLLATRPFPARSLTLTLIELPLVLPPAAAGIGLLAALGPNGLIGGALRSVDAELTLQTAGVVVALVFVASPFYLTQARTAFQAVQRTHVEAALALGARRSGVFLRVALPIAREGLLAGAALAWARALGEFGATLMFAGSFQGVTQTAPLAIYDQFASDFPAAIALSVVLMILSGCLLLAIKLLGARAQPPM